MSSTKSYSSSRSSSSKIRTFHDGLPRSVCDAPPELRQEIRRRQNTENARKMRERQRSQMMFMERKYEENQHRIDQLEKSINDLSAELMVDTLSTNTQNSRYVKAERIIGDPFWADILSFT